MDPNNKIVVDCEFVLMELAETHTVYQIIDATSPNRELALAVATGKQTTIHAILPDSQIKLINGYIRDNAEKVSLEKATKATHCFVIDTTQFPYVAVVQSQLFDSCDGSGFETAVCDLIQKRKNGECGPCVACIEVNANNNTTTLLRYPTSKFPSIDTKESPPPSKSA